MATLSQTPDRTKSAMAMSNLVHPVFKPAVVHTGLETPETTPVQHPIKDPSQDLASPKQDATTQDPIMFPSSSPSKGETSPAPLFSRPASSVAREHELPSPPSSQVAAKSVTSVEQAFTEVERDESLSQMLLRTVPVGSTWPQMDSLLTVVNYLQPRDHPELNSTSSLPRVRRTPAPTARRTSAATARRNSGAEARPAANRRASTSNKRASPEGGPDAKRMRAAAVAKPKIEKADHVPNYCPPWQTLDASAVRPFLHKGQRIDLSQDPRREELHPLEREFAEVNQLDGEKYLINKRLIFQRRLRHYLQGEKPFSKTHAQAAGRVDVNKASRMWEFFDQGGWFNMSHFTPESIAAERAVMLAHPGADGMTVAKQFL